MLFIRRTFTFTFLILVSLIMLTCSNFFFISHSLPLFLSWFLISTSMGKEVGCILLISSLWLGPSIYFFHSDLFSLKYFFSFVFNPFFLAYLIFVTTTFRLEVFKFKIFYLTWESLRKIHEKCGVMGVHSWHNNLRFS